MITENLDIIEGRFWTTLAVIVGNRACVVLGLRKNVYLLIINNPFIICSFCIASGQEGKGGWARRSWKTWKYGLETYSGWGGSKGRRVYEVAILPDKIPAKAEEEEESRELQDSGHCSRKPYIVSRSNLVCANSPANLECVYIILFVRSK